MAFDHLRIISAGAGSGKTFRLTQELTSLLREKKVRPDGILATTFTRKAAAELQERVRVNLLRQGLRREAELLNNALIGTVHGLGVKLLQRFAFEAGVSPAVSIIAEEDQQVLFNQSLSNILTEDRVHAMNVLCQRLSLEDDQYDWRKELLYITEVSRANGFDESQLRKSAEQSVETYRAFLGEQSERSPEEWLITLKLLAEQAVAAIQGTDDHTKATQNALVVLKKAIRDISVKGELNWGDWARISKIKPGAKCRNLVEEVQAWAVSHDQHVTLQRDIQQFTDQIFRLAITAIQEYTAYKKRRGLIDYTDMEVLVDKLLDEPSVQAILQKELDLLLVDEFQDTSPIQLSIFLKLARVAGHSIWVGDPKQSIYGFRGADPALMKSILESSGGVNPDDIQKTSWRSREDIVRACNAIFVKAFPELPPEQVALHPNRNRVATEHSQNKIDEPKGADLALQHWHLIYEPEGEESKRHPGKSWTENALARQIREVLSDPPLVFPKGEKNYRPLFPGDIAVLCTTNRECEAVADAIHRAGLEAAISRTGLLETAEARLVIAALKYILNPNDNLAIAELLVLGENIPVEEVLGDRLSYKQNQRTDIQDKWGAQHSIIQQLNHVRPLTTDLSSSELLEVLLDELALRTLAVRWGKASQRLDNIERLRQMSAQYEEACNRLHTAASLGGFLLWLEDQKRAGQDKQGAGERPEAINVLTYHRSKGLEWPMVICYNLDKKLRAEVWGLALQTDVQEIDLNNILGNRWLRYWINPYGKQYRNTNLEVRIEQSSAKREREEEARREDARLLYVGLTRARDYLVFPTHTGQPTRWLNRTWHDGQEDVPTLDPDASDSPWYWNDQIIPIKTIKATFSRTFEPLEGQPLPHRMIRPPAGKALVPHLPFFIEERQHSIEQVHYPLHCEILDTISYAPALRGIGNPLRPALGIALKDILTAWSDQYPPSEKEKITRQLLWMHPDLEHLETEPIIQLMDAWETDLRKRFAPTVEHRKYPLHYPVDGRHFRTVLDLILETDQGLALIQHSEYSGPKKKWKQQAGQLGIFYYMSSRALQKLFPDKSIRMFLHFPMEASMLELTANATLF